MKKKLTHILLTALSLLSLFFCGTAQAQDYTISTAGSALVITDNLNSSLIAT